jgi:hypothetical protein
MAGVGQQPPEPRTPGTAKPVTHAIDPKRFLSPTPSTPIGAVDGVVDRSPILSMA